MREMPQFSQGVMEDGAAILRDGIPMTPEEILDCLRALSYLVVVKDYKDENGKTQEYREHFQPRAWEWARKSLGL